MLNKVLFILIFLFFGTVSHAQVAPDSTGTAIKPIQRKGQIKFTTRLHTRGMFLYGGKISTDNPALDFNFTYNRPQWGFFFYKAVDLKDHTSPNNFSLAAFFKNFKLSGKLTFTPYVGAFFEQAHSLMDGGSDVLALAVTTFKINSNFSVDYTLLFPNLVIEPESLDWVNRGRILFTSRHIEITSSYWHNNDVFDDQDHMSAAVAISYNKIRLSNTVNLSVGATEFVMFRSSDEESLPTTNRFLLTVAVQFAQ